MQELKKAMEEITFITRKFPKRAFQVIEKHLEEAIPYLYDN